ncbi:MAG: extracellular solute-binding protein [Ardenticatenaceae bacterium]|nr:extracellular solute-binding protein [Ardenticatenaceae bacterium]
MSNQFEWEFDEEREMEEPAAPPPKPSWWPLSWWRKRPLLLLILLVGLLLGGGGGWRYARLQLEQTENALKADAQTVLDAAHAAYLDGDASRFFATQSLDPGWRAAQLRPENQVALAAGLTATRAEQHDDILWINASWHGDAGVQQRILFFQWQGGQLVQIPTDPRYWGTRVGEPQAWGRLVLYEVDRPWANEVTAFVADTIADLCAADCVADRLPLTIILDDRFEETAVSGELRLPSPRLLGLDENGEPGSLFWQRLREGLTDALTPATIRFLVPQNKDRDFQLAQMNIYYAAAQDFMAANPHITIELVAVDNGTGGNLTDQLRRSGIEATIIATEPGSEALLLSQFDAVGTPPTEAMLQAGLVRDLTRMANTDPTFDPADFYEQVWQGIIWRDRAWMIPYAASMRLVYYDQEAYEQAGLRPPSLRWTWDEMAVNLRGLTTNPPLTMPTSLGFIDASTDTLYAYAYNWNNVCGESATVRCQHRLATQNVAAALAWYQGLQAQPNFMPDLTTLTAQEREDRVRGEQMLRRQIAVWVDAPSTYEDYQFGRPIGIVPFPGSDRFDGITPLEVWGTFMTQGSKRPLATWQWLKYISHYPLPLPLRTLPARPSTAAQIGFWEAMPPPLADAMRTAFPFARPIRLDEKEAITWEMITAVINGSQTPEEAAGGETAVSWFGVNGD